MFDRDQPKPRDWKALLATLVFSVPLALLARAVIPMTDLVWFLLPAGMTLAIAWAIHLQMINDWRAKYHMNLTTFEKRRAVGRNIRIGRR
jgi:hypothetical protein